MDRKKRKNLPVGGVGRKNRFSKIIFRSMAILFLGVVFYVIFFSDYLSIKKISVSGLKFIMEEEIAKEIDEEKSKKIFFVLPKNNWLFFPSDELEKRIKEKNKQIKDLKIEKKFPSALEISVFERTPSFFISNGKNKMMADEFGEAYEKADFFSPEQGNSFLEINDESGKEIVFEDASLRLDYFSFASKAKNELKSNLNLELENVFRTPNLISNDLRSRTKEGWEIYFNIRFPVEKTIEILGAVLEEKIPSEKTKDLEYVDLRIENKVYFKMKEGVILETKEPSEEKTEAKKKK